MGIVIKEITDITSIFAIVISIISLYIVHRTKKEVQRPLLIAEKEEINVKSISGDKCVYQFLNNADYVKHEKPQVTLDIRAFKNPKKARKDNQKVNNSDEASQENQIVNNSDEASQENQIVNNVEVLPSLILDPRHSTESLGYINLLNFAKITLRNVGDDMASFHVNGVKIFYSSTQKTSDSQSQETLDSHAQETSDSHAQETSDSQSQETPDRKTPQQYKRVLYPDAHNSLHRYVTKGDCIELAISYIYDADEYQLVPEEYLCEKFLEGKDIKTDNNLFDSYINVIADQYNKIEIFLTTQNKFGKTYYQTLSINIKNNRYFPKHKIYKTKLFYKLSTMSFNIK